MSQTEERSPVRSFLQNYRQRHQHPANVALHAVGLPLTFVAPIPLYVHGTLAWAVGAFLAGYVLQFVGHAIEGNDAGEVILVKKWLGIRYIDIADRSDHASGSS